MEVAFADAALIAAELMGGYCNRMREKLRSVGVDDRILAQAANTAHTDAHAFLNNLDDSQAAALYNMGDILIAVGKALQMPLKHMRGE